MCYCDFSEQLSGVFPHNEMMGLGLCEIRVRIH
jgi:hypothetical protein